MNWKTWIRRGVALAGAAAPIAFIIIVLSAHGMMDFARNYEPLRQLSYLLIVLSLLCVSALAVDIKVARSSGRERGSRAARATAILAWVAGTVALVVTAGLGLRIAVPRLLHPVDTPPRLILAETLPPLPAPQPSSASSATASPSGVAAQPSGPVPGLAIFYYTDKPTKSTVEWNIPGRPAEGITWMRPSSRHRADLGRLAPDTLYTYKVDGGPSVPFRTPPSTGQPLRFAAGGDVHVGSETSDAKATKALLGQIMEPSNRYSALFILGDLVQLGFDNAMWGQATRTLAPQGWAVPTVVLPGNHDTMLDGIDLFERHELRRTSTGYTPPWRRIDIGNVHFLLLDLEWELQEYTPDQKAWLEKQLASIPKDDWKIVMCHTFFYCSGGYKDGWAWHDNEPVIRTLSPLLERSRVQLVMSAHTHHNELLKKNGVTYVVSGAFGGKPDMSNNYISPASVWLKRGVMAFADVSIDGDTATITFRDTAGRALYTTSIKR